MSESHYIPTEDISIILPKALKVTEFKSSTPMTNLLPIISYCNRLHQFHDKEIYITNTETKLLTATRLSRLRTECPNIGPPNISIIMNFWITVIQMTFRNNWTIDFTDLNAFVK